MYSMYSRPIKFSPQNLPPAPIDTSKSIGYQCGMPKVTATSIGSFCRELVLQLEPIEDLLKSWELTPETYAELRKSTFFQNELRSAVAEVREMGPDAGFIARCKLLAEDSLQNMVDLMQHAHTPPEVKVKLFDTFTDLGRLKPVKQAAGGSAADGGQRGPQVVFNFGAGMRGLPTSMEVTAVPEALGADNLSLEHDPTAP